MNENGYLTIGFIIAAIAVMVILSIYYTSCQKKRWWQHHWHAVKTELINPHRHISPSGRDFGESCDGGYFIEECCQCGKTRREYNLFINEQTQVN
jgi:hypothetical protein